MLSNSDSSGRILIKGKKVRLYVLVRIGRKIIHEILKEACSHLVSKITENCISHGSYLGISYAVIIIQQYGGYLDLSLPEKDKIDFTTSLPLR